MTDFAFNSGEKLDAPLELHYQILGQLWVAPDGSGRTSAVLILHGTTQSSDQYFLKALAAQLFSLGQALDARSAFPCSRTVLVMTAPLNPSRSNSNESMAAPSRRGKKAMAMRAGYYLMRLMFTAPVSMVDQYSAQSAADGSVKGELDHEPGDL
ncbi:hypothetical protein PG996_007169 [Apiospora saccharicola]|uniref:Uncharacterized protein n=1 Tax=Apiospora saccharicola TaxID=335842 RepID=A0ABR1VA16_9PEZI